MTVKHNPVPETGVKITFSHPWVSALRGDLNININPDAVTWAYGLNTQSYPTYGGEVVQILSVFFDDMKIQGTVQTYAEIEWIYSWFIAYMQVATQGIDHPDYNQQPVTFNYWDRGWVFNIWPKSLPGFRYGRDVVAPTWNLIAAVKEPEVDFSGAATTLSQQIMTASAFKAQQKDSLTTFGVATADFGTTADLQNNPFAAADAPDAIKAGTNVASYLSQQEGKLADEFIGFVGNWNSSGYTSLPEFQNISIPTQAAGATSAKTPTTKQGSVKK